MKVDFGNGEVEAIYNFYTLYLYEQEFGSDLVKDVFGVVTDDVQDSGVLFDFSKVNWTSVVKALWAGVKCANPSTPRFEEWARGIGGNVEFMRLAETTISEINKELFRF